MYSKASELHGGQSSDTQHKALPAAKPIVQQLFVQDSISG